MKSRILSKLNPRCSLGQSEEPASVGSINDLKEYSSIIIPEEYLELVNDVTDVEIGVDGQFHIRIWGPLRIIEMIEAYDVYKYIPTSLAIGDNEGGQALIYMQGEKGFGIYKSGFGDLDAEDAVWISKDLTSLLVDGEGLDRIPS
ncbi:hypothetical protein [Cerasicoccus frondis]|uniref:hypothetical protein n=1 Tax=Cerasicoccus frondis TaxID=490090 RepID=UPI00285257A9|nr:hypothetical protein [Cerasicoccus frondis]